MGKMLKKVNKRIQITDSKFNKINNNFGNLKKDIKSILLQSGFHQINNIVPAGSFGKHIVTSKTEDLDINIFFTHPQCNHNDKTMCKKLMRRFKDNLEEYASKKNYDFKSTKSSYEVKIQNFSYSFTFVSEKIYKMWWNNIEDEDLKFKGLPSYDVNVLLKGANISKNQRWNIRKYLKLMRYFFASNMQDLYSYQLENFLTKELVDSKEASKGALNQYHVFKKWLSKLGEGKFDDNLKNLEIKNETAFKSLKNRSKKLSNKLPQELTEFVKELSTFI